MELANNTFNKGLLMDTNPMIQGTDSLTDCLNGTLITMNGNEVILQNDMGNRRVDNAFLPNGYEPVGIKEYGGVIYVAAYNPITNKSQIGSFPSPERKIDKFDNEDLKGEFNFNKFLNSLYGNIKYDEFLGIDVLESDSFLIPLTSDKSLHAGDKFAIYSSTKSDIANYDNSVGLSSIKSDITNYDNINNKQGNYTQAYSPKNRRYTLQVGVLNSLNEFVDITKSLCRWIYNSNEEKWTPKKYDNSYSEIYKFNDGYFISDEFDDPDLGETKDDAILIAERLKIAANTYSYKLVGPLYLKVSLNHIYSFNYNIYGTYDNNVADLQIEGYITYNCPDWLIDPNHNETALPNSNENYLTFEEYIPKFDAFELIGKTEVNSSREVSKYNPGNNLYSTKIVKYYENISPNNDNDSNVYDYTIGVLADKDKPNVYLKGLSVKGSIDLSLLGSGIVDINTWRFYNDVKEEKTYLTFGFNAYPKYGEEFTNLKFTFTDNTSNSDNAPDFIYPRDEELNMYNGILRVEIDWNKYNIKPRKLYSVDISYDVLNSSTKEVKRSGKIPIDPPLNSNETRIITRWFLSTELFNDFYPLSEGIDDFCNTTNTDFLEKMKIKFKGSNNIRSSSEIVEQINNSLVSTDEDILYSCDNTMYITINSKSIVEIENKELYPDFVDIDKEAKLLIIGFTPIELGGNTLTINDNLSEKFLDIIGTTIGHDYDINNDQMTITESDNLLEINSINLNSNNDELTAQIQYKDIYKSHSSSECLNFENVFCDWTDVFTKIPNDVLPKLNLHFGIVIEWNRHAGVFGKDDDHFVCVAYGDECEKIGKDNAQVDNWYTSANATDDGEVTFLFSEISKDTSKNDGIYTNFNKCLNKNKSDLMFTYIFIKGTDNTKDDNRHVAYSGIELNLDEVPKDGTPYTTTYPSMSPFSIYDNVIFNNGFAILINPTTGELVSVLRWMALINEDKLDKNSLPGKYYTRLWWRTNDERWALCKNLLRAKNLGTTLDPETGNVIDNYDGFDDNYNPTIYSKDPNTNLNMIDSNVITNAIGANKNYVYCLYNEYNGDDLGNFYVPLNDFIYTNLYEDLPLVMKIEYNNVAISDLYNLNKINSFNYNNDNFVNGTITGFNNKKIGNLIFKVDNTIENISPDEVTFMLKPSYNFHNSIKEFDYETIKNIYISGDTILQFDDHNRKLNPSMVYLLVEDENTHFKHLEMLSQGKSPFEVLTGIYNPAINILLYKPTAPSSDENMSYQLGASGDSLSILKYDQVITVDI